MKKNNRRIRSKIESQAIDNEISNCFPCNLNYMGLLTMNFLSDSTEFSRYSIIKPRIIIHGQHKHVMKNTLENVRKFIY